MSSFNLTEALFGKRPEEGVWQDIEIRFDSPQHELVTRKGEDVLEYLVGPSSSLPAPCTTMHPADGDCVPSSAPRMRWRTRKATMGSAGR